MAHSDGSRRQLFCRIVTEKTHGEHAMASPAELLFDQKHEVFLTVLASAPGIAFPAIHSSTVSFSEASVGPEMRIPIVRLN